MPMSNTPRTDELLAALAPCSSHMERRGWIDFARALERELAEARNERDAITRHAMKFEGAIARFLDGNRHDEDADELRCTLDTTGHELALRCIGCDSGAVLGEPIPHADDCAAKQPHRQGTENG